MKFSPQLECLEKRCCLAASAFVQGDTLIIRADNRANVVEIFDDGVDRIQVSVDGVFLTDTRSRNQNGSHSHSSSGDDNRQRNQNGSQSNSSSSDDNRNGNRNGSHSNSNSSDDGQGGNPGQSDFFTGIDRVVVQTMKGNDSVSYTLTGELINSRSLDINLGDGNDDAVFDFMAGVASPELRVNVLGQAGKDAVAADFGAVTGTNVSLSANLGKGNDSLDLVLSEGLFDDAALRVNARGGDGNDFLNVSADAQVHIDSLALLDLNLLGDAGADRITVDYLGALDGDLLLRAAGGKGNDAVAVHLDLDPGSAGLVSARVLGDAGNDNLKLKIWNAEDLASIDALLDGGAGRDTFSTTANVTVRRGERRV
ncbi:MAG: hypothetical protein WD872_03175 [Pirellulaceae bacterium]